MPPRRRSARAASSAPYARPASQRSSSAQSVSHAQSDHNAVPNATSLSVPDITSAIQTALAPVVARLELLEQTGNRPSASASCSASAQSPQPSSTIQPSTGALTVQPATHVTGSALVPVPQPQAMVPLNVAPDTTPAADLGASSASASSSRDNFPRLAVPARLRDRIVKGEFVEFDDLLSEALSSSDEGIVNLAVGKGQSIQLVQPRRAGQAVKRRVHDLCTWLEAWTTYVRVLTDVAPERTPDLLQYQATIVDANTNYTTEAWLSYDRKFRMSMSLKPHALSWAVIDTNLWQSAFTSKGRPSCLRCNLVHPGPGPVCPFRSGPSSASGGGQRIFTHNGKPVCRNYNRGSCTNNKCPRAHVCCLCRGNHTESSCTTLSKSA